MNQPIQPENTKFYIPVRKRMKANAKCMEKKQTRYSQIEVKGKNNED